MTEAKYPLAEVPESELVLRAQQRDAEAFQELMRRTSSASMRLALSIVKNREEAEDQVQMSFFSAWRSLGSFHMEAKFSTWMRTIVSNQSLMHLRSKRRNPTQSLDNASEDGPAQEPADTRADQETALSRSELSGHVRNEVSKLPAIFREVLELRDFQELPLEDVAARLGVTEPAAKSRLARARQMLRERMERHLRPGASMI